MTYNLDGYVDVPTRLRMALEKYPDLRVVEAGHNIVEFSGGKTFLVCSVAVYLTPDDTRPVTGSAWEPIPGKTKFTADSEWMVGFTSALGRALGYLGFGIEKAIASQNEVDARTSDERPSEASRRPSEPPKRESLGSAAAGPTDAQKRMIRALGHSGPIPTTKAAASSLIDTLKSAQQAIDAMKASPDDPF